MKSKKNKSPLKIVLFVLLILTIATSLYIAYGWYNKNKVTTDNQQNIVEVVDEVETDTELNTLLNNLIGNFKFKYGNVPEISIYIKDLKSDEWVVYNDVQMNSASVIKLYVAMAAYEKDGLNIPENIKKDLDKMITESDNDATNNVIDQYTFGAINRSIYMNGYRLTELRRKVHNTLPPEGPSGEDNLTSAKEVGIFLEKVWKGTMVDEKCSKDLLGLLAAQKRVNKIPAKLDGQNVKVYNKTGELASVENDVAIITGVDNNGEPFECVFCVLVNEIPNNETKNEFKKLVQGSIADMAVEVVTYFKDPDSYIKNYK